MKHAKKDATTLALREGWTVWDYAMTNKHVGVSFQEISGRVPDSGSGKNTVCWEAYVVVSGTVIVYVNGEAFELLKGDVIEVLPGATSYLVADHAEIITITNPDWYEGQFESVPETNI